MRLVSWGNISSGQAWEVEVAGSSKRWHVAVAVAAASQSHLTDKLCAGTYWIKAPQLLSPSGGRNCSESLQAGPSSGRTEKGSFCCKEQQTMATRSFCRMGPVSVLGMAAPSQPVGELETFPSCHCSLSLSLSLSPPPPPLSVCVCGSHLKQDSHRRCSAPYLLLVGYLFPAFQLRWLRKGRCSAPYLLSIGYLFPSFQLRWLRKGCITVPAVHAQLQHYVAGVVTAMYCHSLWHSESTLACQACLGTGGLARCALGDERHLL